MKKLKFFIPILSLGIFLLFIYSSSPYRQLRPYPIFGEKVKISSDASSKIIQGRKTILIPETNKTDTFYIDQIPVTISDYKKCILSGNCLSHHYRDNFEKYWNNTLYEVFPVSFVTFDEARVYCVNAGGDLPTAEQWEIAAGTALGYKYAWGNDNPSLSRANIDGYYQGLTPAGWLPDGASPYGVLDLNGNVREWILDEDPADPEGKALKGGSFQDSYSSCRNDYLFYHWLVSAGLNRGFRCVYDN